MERFDSFTRILPGSSPAPRASISVSTVGDPLALQPIFSDNLTPPTPKSNPFEADDNGEFFFYAANGRYDVNIFDINEPYTLSDIQLGPSLLPLPLNSPQIVSEPDGYAYNAVTGEIIDTTGTLTDGIQEAINYCTLHRYSSLHIGVGGKTAGDVVRLMNGQIRFPPSEQFRLTSDYCILWWQNAPTFSAIYIDSSEDCNWYFPALIYSGSDNAIIVRPTAPTPLGGLTNFVDSQFRLESLSTGGAPAGVALNGIIFDTTIGSIDTNEFWCGSITGTQVGVACTNDGHGFTHNFVDCLHIFLCTVAQVVASNTSFFNTWRVNANSGQPGAYGVIVNGMQETWDICSQGSDPNKGLFLNTAAIANIITLRRCDGGLVNLSTNPNRIFVIPAPVSSEFTTLGLGYAVTTPAIPGGSGTPVKNTSPYPVVVQFLTTGTAGAVVTQDLVGTAGPSMTIVVGAGIYLMPGEFIVPSWTGGGAPTWKWRAVP